MTPMRSTAWDGIVTVVHLSASKLVRVALQTSEPVTERLVRPGLTLGFATADPAGPPVVVQAALPVPEDVLFLLGGVLRETLRGVLAGEPRVRWAQLSLEEVGDLAAAWAPYRGDVLCDDADRSTGPLEVGRWARTWWTRVTAAAPVAAHVRGPGERPEPRGEWWLPPGFAATAGVHPHVTWERRHCSGRSVLTVRAAPEDGDCRLDVAADDGGVAWTPLVTDGSGLAVADLDGDRGPDETVRFRVRVPEIRSHEVPQGITGCVPGLPDRWRQR
ncbi:hypothetical protein AB0L04_13185 [Streptomyces glaucescens]|uniref:hypothetical protein n=1 Tax=Streptomyces glaucescens TaxID=1907 RepID=UPI00344FDF4F